MRLVAAALLIWPFLPQDAETQKLIQKLGSTSFEEQGKAATILESLGNEALADLRTAAKSDNSQIREWAAKIITRIEKRLTDRRADAQTETRKWVAGQVERLDSPDEQTRNQAAESLKGRPDFVPHLRDALQQASGDQLKKLLGQILDSYRPKLPSLEGAAGWTGKYPSRFAPKAGLLGKAGGGTATEASVLAGLKWLARHQGSNGGWEAESFRNCCSGKKCMGAGERDYDNGVTGLALLAFFGGGFGPDSKEEFTDPVTTQTVKFGEVVLRGIGWLLTQQDREGCIGERGMKYMYNHQIATLALCEVYGLTGSPTLRMPVQKALDFTAASQNPDKAWRYSAKCGDNDTSVTGWALLALKAGELSGFVPGKDVYPGALRWLDEATDRNDPYQVGYNARGTGKVYVPGKNEEYDHHPTMTAIGLVSRGLLQKPRKDSVFGGFSLVVSDLPEWKTNKTDCYYWFWGTQALYLVDGPSGPHWKKWFEPLKSALAQGQEGDKDRCQVGSWNSERDRWGAEGGRVYATALAVLTLETPYRVPLLWDNVVPFKLKK
jgi:hypothetical protein